MQTTSSDGAPRPFVLLEANYRQLLDDPPRVAILPWGATEAHNYHMPHGTDVIEATAIAERGAELAHGRGARPIVLPAVPFGNNAQQLDQRATIHCSTATAAAILHDVAASLKAQGIDRLIILNGHGGNEFKPLVRDATRAHGMLIVVANFYQMAPEVYRGVFEHPGDHADEMETSLLMHLCPHLLAMGQAGPGERVPFAVRGMGQAGVWAPRPWSASHPDTGCGDPSAATAEKGRAFFEAIAASLAELIEGLDRAKKGDLPYV